MNSFLSLSLEARVALIAFLGTFLGAQVNRAIYRFAWDRRRIGPWESAHDDAPSRRWSDYIPIIGWFGLRRENAIHGRGFWIRPLLIEIGVAVGMAWLYWWEMNGRLMPSAPRLTLIAPSVAMLHAQYLSHVILIALMTIATFIDFDDKIIPDEITVPGTLIGLGLAAGLPISTPRIAQFVPPASMRVEQLLMTSPNKWPISLDSWLGLMIALSCYTAWCLAIWPRTATLRRGLAKGIRYLYASMFCRPRRWFYMALLALGCAAIVWVWSIGGPAWRGLLTSLVGVVFGGGLIWAVRLVAGGALGEEAMGFGDVTLMAMIGAFLGWQATLIIFFLAPFVAIFVALTQWIITRRRDIAFGPYLCIAAAIVILRWSQIWEANARMIFALGWIVPGLVLCCLALMAGLLRIVRLTKEATGYR